MRFVSFLIAAAAVTAFAFSGCDSTSEKGNSKAKTGEHDHDHDHGEDGHAAHEDIHGPKGGHVVKFTPADFTGEWTHDDNLVRLYFMKPDMETPVTMKVDSVTIQATIGEERPTFNLDPDNPNEAGETNSFSLDDQNLMVAMNLGVKIEMKTGDKTYSVVVPPHKPH